MWVDEDGLVLRQEVTLFRSPIQFERVPNRLATDLRARLPENWRQPMASGLGRQLLEDLQSALSSESGGEVNQKEERPVESSAYDPKEAHLQ
jgi:hypothetical protein